MKMPVVLVIREDGSFSSLLSESGCEVINLELTEIVSANDLNELNKALDNIRKYEGLFFTSPGAAAVFIHGLGDRRLELRGKIYVLGDRTRRLFADAGFDVAFSADVNTAHELVNSFERSEFAGKRLLFVRGDRSVRTIPDVLGKVATVDEVVAYKSVEKRPGDATVKTLQGRFRDHQIDWICFFSPAGVDRFRNIFGPDYVSLPKTAVIGTTTAKRAGEVGIRVDLVSRRATAREFAEALLAQIKNIG